MKPWLFLIVAAITGGIGGFILGKASSSHTAAEENDPSMVVSTAGGLLGGSAVGSAGPSASSRRVNPASLRRELETIKKDPNPINRFGSLTQLLGELAPENLDAVLQAFDEIPMRYEHREEYQMLMYAWAAFDPASALKFVEENANSRSIKKDDLLKPLVSSWASNDPEKTLEWLQSLPEKDQKDTNLLSGLIEGWAVNDPYAAADYLKENVEAGKNREQLAGEIASHLFKQDPLEAAKWAEAQEDLQFREEAFEELAEDWASVNPRELANWLDKHVAEEYSVEAFEDLARGWVSQDPDAATAYFEALPDGRAKESGIYEMARTWGKDDLGALGEWLNGLPDSNVTDLGVKAYVERLADQSPEAAIQSALSINTDHMRDAAVQNAGRQWFQKDPAAATAWASANGIPVETFQADGRQIVIDGKVITESHIHAVGEALHNGALPAEQLGRLLEAHRALDTFGGEAASADDGTAIGAGLGPAER